MNRAVHNLAHNPGVSKTKTRAAKNNTLVFHRYGGQYFLVQVWEQVQRPARISRVEIRARS